MVYVPIGSNEYPNIHNILKRTDPDGSLADIAEVIMQYNPILEDIYTIEGNLPTGHRTTVRVDHGNPTWRAYNKGIRPSKSNTEQVDDTCGMLEDYSVVDKDLAELNGNTAAFRLSEDEAIIQGISNEMATTIFYGTGQNRDFLGLAPRYDNIGTPAGKFGAREQSAYLKNVIDAGGSTAGSQTSVWYMVHGEQFTHGIFPKGSKAGLSVRDLGEETVYDNEGGQFQGYRTHYQWKMGLVVRDWRYIVRIANIELANLENSTAQKALYKAMIRARYTLPQGSMSGRGVYYCSPAVLAMLDLAGVDKENANLGWTNIFGKDVRTFRGTPFRTCDAILETEAVLTA